MTIANYTNLAPNAPAISSAYAPTFRDDFSSAGNLNGRSGWSIGYLSGFSGQVNAITAASGKAGGTTGSGMWAFTSTPVANAIVQRRMGITPLAAQSSVMHANFTNPGINGFTYSNANALSGAVPTSLFSILKYVNNSPTTIVSFATGRFQAGDVFREDHSTPGQVTMYRNGWQILAPTTLSGNGITLSGQFGLIGNTGASTLDDIQVVSPATQAWISQKMGGHVWQRNDDGSATWVVRGLYNQDVPTRLVYTLYDLSTGSEVAVTGHTDKVVSASTGHSFTASAGVFGFEFTVASGLLGGAGPFVLKVVRDRLTGGGQSVSFSPSRWLGDTILAAGQSLAVGSSRQAATTSPTYTAPANSFWIAGEPTNVSTLGADYTRYETTLNNDTTATAFAQAWCATTGKAICLASGGVSAQPIANRKVGTASHNALIEAHERGGYRCLFIEHTDGQSDLGNVTNYNTDFNAIYDDMAARNGGSIRVLLNPIAAGWAAAAQDETWQEMRRNHWKLCQDNPTKYFLGAFTLDIQHTLVSGQEALHLDNNGYGEMRRRAAWAGLKARGLVANDRNGPSMASVTRIDDHTVDVWFDLNGFDSLSLLNTAYAGEYHGGLMFSTGSAKSGGTIAVKKYPTGATVDASPTGTQQKIRFTFPNGTFPGSVYVWAGYGRNPFNPTDDGLTTNPINRDFANKASMIVGVKSGEPNVGLRPRYTADASDYIMAT